MDHPEDKTEAIEGNFEIAPMQAITKAEIDSQIATARQFPRKLSEFFKRAEAMITSDPETAESCLYSLRRRDPESPSGYKIIEGESIGMAEIVAANFGNLRSAVHVISSTPTRVGVRAVCHDLEVNNLIAVEKQAKTTYRDGSPYSDDMQIVATNALVSKALRDAIFRVVPKALIKPLKEKAKLVAFGQGAAFTARRQKAFDWATKTRKIPEARVFAALGVAGLEDIGIDHLTILSGLKTAILDGDQTVDEAFPASDGAGKPTAENTFARPEANPKTAATAEAARAATAKTAPAASVKTPAPVPRPAPDPVVQPEIKVGTDVGDLGEVSDDGDLGPQTTEPAAVAAAETFEAIESEQTRTTEPAATEITFELQPAVEEPKPKPAPAPVPAPAAVKKPAATAPAPAKAPAPAPAMAAAAAVPGQAGTSLSPAQEALRTEVEKNGFTLQEFLAWANGSILAKNTIYWSDIPDGKAAILVKSIGGVVQKLTEKRQRNK